MYILSMCVRNTNSKKIKKNEKENRERYEILLYIFQFARSRVLYLCSFFSR